MSAVVRRVLITLVIIVAVIVIGLLVLQSPPVRNYVLSKAVKTLEANGVQFSAEDLDYNIFNLSASLRNVVVRSPQAPDLPPVAKLDYAHVEMRLAGLVSGNYTLQDVEVRGLRLHPVFTEDGRNNIPKFTTSSKPEEKEQSGSILDKVFIEKLRTPQGWLQVEDRKNRFGLMLPQWALSIDGQRTTRDYKVNFDLQQPGTASYQGRTMPVPALTLEAKADKDSAEFKRLILALGDSQLTASGTVKDFSSPKLDLSLEGNLQLASLTRFAGMKPPAGGSIEVQGKATGPVAAVDAELSLRGHQIRYKELNRASLVAEAVYDRGAERLKLSSLKLDSNLGRIEARADLALSDAAGKSSLSGRLQQFDLERLARSFGSKTVIASLGSGTVQAEWPGMRYEAASGAAQLKLQATRAQAAKNVLPVSGELKAESRGKAITAQLKSVSALGANLSGTVGKGASKQLSGQLSANIPNLKTLLQETSQFQGKPPMNLSLGGSAQVLARLGGTLQKPQATLSVTSPNLQVGELRQIAFNLNADYGPAAVVIRRGDARWDGSTLALAGTVGLEGKSPSLNLSASLQHASVQDILKAAGKAGVPAEGELSLRATVGGTVKAPTAQAQLTGSGLKAYQQPLGNLTMTAQLRNQQVTIPELRLEPVSHESHPVSQNTRDKGGAASAIGGENQGGAASALGRENQGGAASALGGENQGGAAGKIPAVGIGVVTASGSFGLDSKAYMLQLQGNDLNIQQLVLPGGKPVTTKATISASGRGTLDDPRLTAALKLANVNYAGKNFGDLKMDVAVQNQQAHLKAQAPLLNLSTQATVGIKAPYPAVLTINADQVDLAKLPLAMPGGSGTPAITGKLTASIRANGELKNLRQATATAEIANLNLQRSGQSIRSQGPIRVHYANKVLDVEPSVIVAGNSKIEVGGRVPLEANVAAANLRLQGNFDLASLAKFVPKMAADQIAGKLTLDVRLGGSLKRLSPEGSIALQQGFFKAPGLAAVHDVSLAAQVQPTSFELQRLQAGFASAAIEANGTVPYSLLPKSIPVERGANAPAKFAFSMTGLQLAQTGAVGQNIRGRISLRLEAQAARASLQALQARLWFPELHLVTNSIPLEQQGETAITLNNGVAHIERVEIHGPNSHVVVTGDAQVIQPRQLNLKLDADTDASILSVFVKNINFSGPVLAQVSAGGTVATPDLHGRISMQGGQMAMTDPAVDLEDLQLQVNLNGNRAELAQFKGLLNGGDLTGSGGLSFGPKGPQDIGLSFQAKNVYFEYPPGFKTASDLSLSLKSQEPVIVLGGEVKVLDGTFKQYINVETQALEFLRSGQSVTITGERSPFLSKLRFDIGVQTRSPLIVDNNLAKVGLNVDARLVGSYYRPSITGRVEMEPGGEIHFNSINATVERGSVVFTSAQRIEPELDIQATTSKAGYDITMLIQGPAGKITTTMTSDPPLPEPDIMSVLIFGRPMEQVRGAEVQVAQQQVLSYMMGSLGGALSAQAQSALGLSEVRIEPELIAAEANPGARITLGKQITHDLELIYSMDLINSGDRIWIARYDVTRRFQAQATKQADNSYRFDFNHDFRFGGAPGSMIAAAPRRHIAEVDYTGNSVLTDKQLQDKFKLKSGDIYDFFKINKGMQRIRGALFNRDRLEARVRLRREETSSSQVKLNVNVDPGPVVHFVYEGWDPPGKVRDEVEKRWRDGVFDRQRIQDAMRAIRRKLIEDRYVTAKVRTQVSTPAPGQKRVVFDITPGRRYKDLRLLFPGANQIPADTLKDVLKDRGLRHSVLTAQDDVKQLLTSYYQEQGYLSVKVQDPRVDVGQPDGVARILLPISEGPQFHISQIKFDGNHAFSNDELLASVKPVIGDTYHPTYRDLAIIQLQNDYFKKGYGEMDVSYDTTPHPENASVDLVFHIAENKQSVVEGIEISGNDQTSKSLIRSQIPLKTGEVLDFEKMAKARSNLYSTGSFNLVEMEPTTSAESAGLKPEQKPVVLTVKVKEVAPFRWKYGAYFDTDRGPGGISDFSTTNTIGDSRVLGLRTRYDANLQEARLYFSQPLLRRLPVKTNAAGYFTRDVHDAFIDDRTGFSVDEETRWKEIYLFTFGYRIERSRVFDLNPDPNVRVNEEKRVAPLNMSITRETRDDQIDARRGSFLSHAFALGANFLGSEQRYIKYYGQYYRYIPLGKQGALPFQPTAHKPRFLYAGALRLGLAKGLGGQDLIRSERFFAGGGTTIRGFAQDEVGPKDVQGTPLGGNALFIFNNEVRFPLISIFDGVAFADVGNVYPSISDFNPLKLRKSAGLGLRVYTPYVILRADYGLKLDRKPGESAGELFFSIGQTF